MGLLDDAIREHLELKRRRGADPEEVARQENEALGAARRAEFARPEGAEPREGGESPQAEAEEAAPDLAAPAEPPDLSAPAEPRDRGAPPGADLGAPEEPVAEAEEPVEAGDEREPFDIEAVEASGSAAQPPTEEHEPWPDEEPDEVPADEALDHPRTAEPEEGEDVLEETPDFLQETPEHDRLWFEQRPPRDFDWDK